MLYEPIYCTDKAKEEDDDVEDDVTDDSTVLILITTKWMRTMKNLRMASNLMRTARAILPTPMVLMKLLTVILMVSATQMMRITLLLITRQISYGIECCKTSVLVPLSPWYNASML